MNNDVYLRALALKTALECTSPRASVSEVLAAAYEICRFLKDGQVDPPAQTARPH